MHMTDGLDGRRPASCTKIYLAKYTTAVSSSIPVHLIENKKKSLPSITSTIAMFPYAGYYLDAVK